MSRFPRVSITVSALVSAFLGASPWGAEGSAIAPAIEPPLRIAHWDTTGHLLRPTDLDRWVFLGASLGMNYNDAAFSDDHPGAFQVVLMEPSAYTYFKVHGHYAEGSMFLLSFYDTERGASIDRAGFTPGALDAFEIHLIDRTRSPDRHLFYPFSKDGHQAAALPPGNACVQCHVPNGAYDGTFAQFYPAIREAIAGPKQTESPATR